MKNKKGKGVGGFNMKSIKPSVISETFRTLRNAGIRFNIRRNFKNFSK